MAEKPNTSHLTKMVSTSAKEGNGEPQEIRELRKERDTGP